MELRLISDTHEYDAFVEASSHTHYMKTSMWASIQERSGYQSQYIGFYNDSALVGTGLLLMRKQYGCTYGYIPKGLCIDKELLPEALELLKEHAKALKLSFLRIDPDILRMERDIQGEPIENGENNEDVTECLKEHGFRHKGYGYAYDGSWTNRYTLIIDISKDMDEIIKGFAKPRQTALKRHKVMHLTTRCGDENDLPDLCEFEKMLCAIQGFKPHPLSFFKQYLDVFKDHAHLYVTEIDLEAMINDTEKEIASGKYNKDKEALASKQKELAQANELMAQYGKQVKIAAGLFLHYGNMSWDLYTYNHKAFNNHKPVDNLHAFAINDLKTHGVTRYDMCGFSGVTDPKDPYYGLYTYKRSFGSVYTEYIGQFDYVLNETVYGLYHKIERIIKGVKRRLARMRYGRKES